MKIIINTQTKTIKEKRHKQDIEMNPVELEKIIANQMAIVIATQAHKTYKTAEVREAYIDMIADTAKKFIVKLENHISPEERLLRNIFGEDTLDDDKEYGEVTDED